MPAVLQELHTTAIAGCRVELLGVGYGMVSISNDGETPWLLLVTNQVAGKHRYHHFQKPKLVR